MLPQSLGVIGGKPNSAHYFIGYVGMSSLQKKENIVAIHSSHTWMIHYGHFKKEKKGVSCLFQEKN